LIAVHKGNGTAEKSREVNITFVIQVTLTLHCNKVHNFHHHSRKYNLDTKWKFDEVTHRCEKLDNKKLGEMVDTSRRNEAF